MSEVPTINKCSISLRPSRVTMTFSGNRVERKIVERAVMEDPAAKDWIKTQLDEILRGNEGFLAARPDASFPHEMRTPGAGILPLVDLKNKERAILHIRGSNRGTPWAANTALQDVLTWKEFAGIIDEVDTEMNPLRVATKELYEELTLLSNNNPVVSRDLHAFAGVQDTLDLGIRRANLYFEGLLPPATTIGPVTNAHYTLTVEETEYVEVVINNPAGDQVTTNGIVNYDPLTNALEVSYIGKIKLDEHDVTGMVSLAGREDINDVMCPPYFEDIVVVPREALATADPGARVVVKHLLSVHGVNNYNDTPDRRLSYIPSPTVKPIIAALDKAYSFEAILREARSKI